jgi:hypothetical protein
VGRHIEDKVSEAWAHHEAVVSCGNRDTGVAPVHTVKSSQMPQDELQVGSTERMIAWANLYSDWLAMPEMVCDGM